MHSRHLCYHAIQQNANAPVEMQFLLDPAAVSSDFEDYETFGALKRAALRQFGEYRTQRLVLEAWDKLFENE